MKEKLLSFWPVRENVNTCIRPEAETDALSILLAVHQPMQFIRRSVSNRNIRERRTETDLLEAFLTPELPSGTLLLPIIGNSGIGKSHIIRWLDAQIRRQNDGIKRHIIRVPKSSSLKEVLFLILEDMNGSEYDEIREALRKAHEQMTVDKAKELLKAHLLIALNDKAKKVQNKMLEVTRIKGQNLDPNLEMVLIHSSEKGLPTILNDIELGKHFMTGSLTKIAKRFIEGLKEGEEPKTQFCENDLTFPDAALDKAAKEARFYYNHINRFGNNIQKEKAVQILNDVIDIALNQLFEQDSSTSLKDIFFRIRKKLLVDNFELILLVEDFAALAGVQGALLDIMIKEGIRDGKQVLCPMRTALALTGGYLANRETVLTRAIDEWIIEDIPDDNAGNTLIRIIDFIGGYLNAARFGEDLLDKQYKDSKFDNTIKWPENFAEHNEPDSDTADILNDFGKSQQGYHLFPYNPYAIKELSERYLFTSDGLTFNPRTIINKILTDILLNYRNDFKDDAFPPPDFLEAHLMGEVQHRILQKSKNRTLQKRYISLVRYWGGHPTHPDDIKRIPLSVYKAFSLPSLSEGTVPPPCEQDPMPPKKPEPEQLRSQPLNQKKRSIEEWREILYQWASGTDVIQPRANQLRVWIRDAVKSLIDWDRELLAPMELDHRLIYIPGARGGQSGLEASKAMIAVAIDDVRKDIDQSTAVQLDLLSVIKYKEYNSWAFDESEESMARYANFIERLTQQAIAYCHKNYRKNGDSLSILAKAAVLGARILNLEKSQNNDKFSYIFAMLQPESSEEINGGNFRWYDLRRNCHINRAKILELLLQQVAARQGGAKKILAVDAVCLLDALGDDFKSGWCITEEFPEGLSEFKNIRYHVKELSSENLQRAIKDFRQDLLEWLNIAESWLGKAFNKIELVEKLKNTLSTAKKDGLYNGRRDYETLRHKDLTFFRDCALIDNIKLLCDLNNESNMGKILSILAQADMNVIVKVRQFIDDYNDFIIKANEAIDTKINIVGDDIIKNIVEEINNNLHCLKLLLNKVKEEDTI